MLKDKLIEWTDVDMALHELATCLGIFEKHTQMREFKDVYWTNNDWGNSLYQMLLQLTSLGVLEHREEPDNQFRWKS